MLLVLLLQGTPVLDALAAGLDPVTIQLKWKPAFQFAGYYAAKELGYYAEAGLDVTIKPGEAGVDVLDEVLSGRANYGTGTSALLLHRKAGKPVVALAVIYQHSPQVFIALTHGAQQSISDLIGKRIMVETGSDELLAYLKREGIERDRIRLQAHSFDLQDLIDGRTDAISAYLTSEPYFLDRAGVSHQIYTPRAAGIDFYGDNLFTSERELQQHPERTKAFRTASLRGWQYAMDHPDEIVDLIARKYGRDDERARYLYEAFQMAYLMRVDLIAVGYMNPGRWRHIADTYADIGMLPVNYSLEGFLYDPNPEIDLRPLYYGLAGALLLAAAVSAIAIYVVGMNRRLARMRGVAEAATSAKSAFLAMMSHEIRTPLNGVMSMAEMLDQTDLTQDQKSMSSVIRASASALLTIINDILDFSKIEAGKLDIEAVPLSLSEVVEGAGELLSQKAEEKGLEFLVDLDPTIPDKLIGDPTRVRQIALNLAGNAVKFTETGSVTIRVRRAPGADDEGETIRLRFEVIDTGIGIAEEQQEKLFKPFVQADSSTARKYGGTGLGLSICQRLVEMMRGAIGVRSAPGKGSTFWFELPFSVETPEAELPQIAIADARVIAVGFSAQQLEILGALLRAASVAEPAAISPEEDSVSTLQARSRESGSAGIVLVAASAASQAGLDIARSIAATSGLEDSKVVLVAPRALASSLAAAGRDGLFATMTWPLRRRRLWHVIAAALGRASLEARQSSSANDAVGWAPPEVEEARSAGALVLVAEDNVTNQIVIKRLLTQRGYAVEIANDGAEALSIYRPGQHGLLLTDFHMPEMDGFELTRRIRATEPKDRRLPIVALTADALPGTEQQCLDAGMDGYLTKPIDSKALTIQLEAHLPQATPLRRRPARPEPRGPRAPDAMADIDPQVLDLSYLNETFGGLGEEMRSFLAGFVADVPRMLQELDQALAAGEQAKARHAAHLLKGAARSSGAVRLGQLASRIQDSLDGDDLETATMLNGGLAKTHIELRDAVAPLTHAPSGGLS